MKRNLIKTIGVTFLIASLGVSGCNAKVEREEEKEETVTTTTAEEETEEELSGCCYSGDEEEEELYSCVSDEDGQYISTNGEFNDQFIYMDAVLDATGLDWENYEVAYIDDLSVIENEDLRALAEELASDGYDIVDPEQDMEYGFALGDGEYMFINGFRGEMLNNDSAVFVYAYRMTEELFTYYMVCPYSYFDMSWEDEGNIIRYTSEDGAYESWYDRDTGIGFLRRGTNY